MADTYLVKTIGGLRPVDDVSKQAFDAYGNGEVIRVKVMRERNPRHHRLFFALLGLVFENQQKYLSLEALRFAVIIQAGYVDEIRLSGDKVILKPKSLSFGSMDQNEFSLFYAAALLALKELLPELAGVDWERELLTRGGA
jgi:hypothetical protein